MSNIDSGQRAVTDERGRSPLGERIPIGDGGLLWRRVPGTEVDAAELPPLVELLRRGFNGGPTWFELPVSHAEHVAWRLAAPGAGELSTVQDGERTVWMQVVWRRPFLLDGRERAVRLGGGMVLDPDLQGRGLYRTISAMKDRNYDVGYDFSIAYSAHPVTVHLSRSLTRETGRTPRVYLGNPIATFRRPLSLRRAADSAAPAEADAGVSVSKTHAVLASSGQRRRPAVARDLAWRWRYLAGEARGALSSRREAAWSVRAVPAFDARVEGLFREAASGFDLIQMRDAAYLNWRYCDPRGGPYTILVAEEGGALLGYAALLLAGGWAALADLLVLPGRDDVAYSLLRAAVARAKASPAAEVRAWLPARHAYRPALERAGFHAVRAPGIGQFRALDMPLDELATVASPDARVHLMLGDSDYI